MVHEVFSLVYMKIALISMLGYFNFTVVDNTTGWSDVVNIILTMVILAGLPIVDIILLIRRLVILKGLKRVAKYKKKPLI